MFSKQNGLKFKVDSRNDQLLHLNSGNNYKKKLTKRDNVLTCKKYPPQKID